MATVGEYAAIAAVISVGIIVAVKADDMKSYFLPDPVKARYEKIDRECAKPRPDGSRRQHVYMDDHDTNFGYAPCPQN